MKKVYLGWCRYYVDNNYTLYRFFSHSNVMFQVIPDSDGDKMKEHIFRVFDKNGDGSIDFSEFMVSKRSRQRLNISSRYLMIYNIVQMVFHIMQRGTPQQILSKLFHTFDINGQIYNRQRYFSFFVCLILSFARDGLISKLELQKLVNDINCLLSDDDSEKVWQITDILQSVDEAVCVLVLQTKAIRRFVITEKAPTRACSWLKTATTAFTFKTLLRHYAKQTLTPR